MKALEILNKILKEINDDNLFLSEDFILNIDIRLSVMELEELNNRSCENCKHWNKLEEGCELTYWQDYMSGYGFESKKDDFCSRFECK